MIENFTISKAYLRGIIVDGLADNTLRARENYGYDSRIDPDDPGILAPSIRFGIVRGNWDAISEGLWVQASRRPVFEGIDIQEFGTGVRVDNWVRSMTFWRGKVLNNAIATKVSGGTEPPIDIVFTDNEGI